MTDNLAIVNNPERMRFEVTLDGHVAKLDYARHGDHLILVHTEVPEACEGHGFGGRLVRAAVDHAVAHHLVVDPRCPFARKWLEDHPDVAATVTITDAPAR